jgi:AcrR family transcriptional regulator
MEPQNDERLNDDGAPVGQEDAGDSSVGEDHASIPGEGAAGTRERILEAAERVLRRHGPAKTTVVDVARALGMSHGNVYRHFASKAALQDAVAARWLHGVSDPLARIVQERLPASERLERWVLALAEAKRRKVLSDPEIFATYSAIALAARDVVNAHVETLRAQVAEIIQSGIDAGEFAPTDAVEAATAVLDATSRFHHPHHVREAAARSTEAEMRAARVVLGLLLAGLRAGQ